MDFPEDFGWSLQDFKGLPWDSHGIFKDSVGSYGIFLGRKNKLKYALKRVRHYYLNFVCDFGMPFCDLPTHTCLANTPSWVYSLVDMEKGFLAHTDDTDEPMILTLFGYVCGGPRISGKTSGLPVKYYNRPFTHFRSYFNIFCAVSFWNLHCSTVVLHPD
jgi:hypothetical protein